MNLVIVGYGTAGRHYANLLVKKKNKKNFYYRKQY